MSIKTNTESYKEYSHLMTFKIFRMESEKYKEFKKVKKLNKIELFYLNMFNSFQALNKCFKKKHPRTRKQHSIDASSHHYYIKNLSDPCIDRKFLAYVYNFLVDLPENVKKTVLLGMSNCLLQQKDTKTNIDTLRAYYMLVQNPLFVNCDSYVVFAHLLKQIANLNSSSKITLSQWLRRLSTPKFRPIVENLHKFITKSISLLRQNDNNLTKWWLPSALDTLQLLYKSNNCLKPRLISFREFYNNSINQIDLLKEFDQWKFSTSSSEFNYCQYPCAFTLISKQRIIKHEQQSEMISNAKDELETQLRRRPSRLPSTDKLFLNIQVRRDHLLQDSLDQIFLHKNDLKKKLRVEFVGEPGFDMGGITKEWFLLLLRQILQPEYNTFVYNKQTRCYWFAHNSADNTSDLFLIGVLLGLAVYNNITLHMRLPLICYRKLLSIPAKLNNYQSAVGNCSRDHSKLGHVDCSLHDLKLVDQELAHGLEELLKYEGDVENDLHMSMETCEEDLGAVNTVQLIAGGSEIPVTNDNRDEYVRLIIDHKLNKSVHKQFISFSRGFHTVCSSVALSFLCAEELEVLICGVVGFSICDLQKFTTYKGYTEEDETVKHLWHVLSAMTSQQQRNFLHFCTGGDRIPVTGWRELNFTVIKAPMSTNMLPMAHTCFNQLMLPPYKSKEKLQNKLLIAIQHSEGFGLE